jgi:hypothetical protein
VCAHVETCMLNRITLHRIFAVVFTQAERLKGQMGPISIYLIGSCPCPLCHSGESYKWIFGPREKGARIRIG